MLSITALECDGVRSRSFDTLAETIPGWNLCGGTYRMKVDVPCNGASVSPSLCVSGGASLGGLSGCLGGCLDAGLDLADYYEIILDITPTTGCSEPAMVCQGASRLAHPSVELLALALVVMAFWR